MEQTKIALENILKKPDYAQLIFMASTGKYAVTDICQFINEARTNQKNKSTSVLFRALKPLKELGLIRQEIEERTEQGKPKKFLHLNYERLASLYFNFLHQVTKIKQNRDYREYVSYFSKCQKYIVDFLDKYLTTVFVYFTHDKNIVLSSNKYVAQINEFGAEIEKILPEVEKYNLEMMFRGFSIEVVKNSNLIRQKLKITTKDILRKMKKFRCLRPVMAKPHILSNLN
jgi:DNA-binding PadR family transcriptional regulator